MTSFTEDMQRRGMVPSSKTMELKTVAAGARLGASCTSRRPSESSS